MDAIELLIHATCQWTVRNASHSCGSCTHALAEEVPVSSCRSL